MPPLDAADDQGDARLDRAAIGRRLATARLATGLTQAEVAEKIGVRRRTVWAWENGEALPSTSMPALGELYGVSARFVLYGIEETSVELVALRREIADLRLLLTQTSDAAGEGLEALRDLVDELRTLVVDELRLLRGESDD